MSPPFVKGSKKKKNKRQSIGPKPTGAPPKEITLTGRVFGWLKDIQQPALFQMPGSPFFYLMCFTYAPNLRDFHSRADVPFDSIKQIDDGREFLETSDFPKDQIRICLDPWFTPEGRVRYTEIQWS